MKYPEYVKIDDKKYKINTDFRVILRCEKVAHDTTIDDYERSLAIIYLLYGDEGFNDEQNYEKLLKLAFKFINKGQSVDRETKRDIDFEKDAGYISSSFKYDYKYDPYEMEYLHWYAFLNDLSNLSNNEMGNCCVLNNVRNLRNLDLSTIKDEKERQRLKEAKELVELDFDDEVVYSDEEVEAIEKFNRIANIKED